METRMVLVKGLTDEPKTQAALATAMQCLQPALILSGYAAAAAAPCREKL